MNYISSISTSSSLVFIAKNVAGFYVVGIVVDHVFNQVLRAQRVTERDTIKVITIGLIIHKWFPLTDLTLILFLAAYVITSLTLSHLYPNNLKNRNSGQANLQNIHHVRSREECIKWLQNKYLPPIQPDGSRPFDPRAPWPNAIEVAVEIAFLMAPKSMSPLEYAEQLLEKTMKKNEARLTTAKNIWNVFKDQHKASVSHFNLLAYKVNDNLHSDVLPARRTNHIY